MKHILMPCNCPDLTAPAIAPKIFVITRKSSRHSTTNTAFQFKIEADNESEANAKADRLFEAILRRLAIQNGGKGETVKVKMPVDPVMEAARNLAQLLGCSVEAAADAIRHMPVKA